ncbi:YopX family protein [Bacillus toyonensis]|uniref:YopX family protein n=1 Tax=Bacillus toyonensis TaxID=155322 RepID=UPI00159B8F3E|nr:YopX family protein [Bacillus toyonensis]
MREIKFDAIYKPTGEHFTPRNINFESKTTHGDFDGQISDWCHFSLDGGYGDAILRQYTGLKDKNGKEIYEGDIVKNKDKSGGCEEENIDFIAFEHGRFVVRDKDRVLLDMWIGDTDLIDIQVIGNIYETPELLKTK